MGAVYGVVDATGTVRYVGKTTRGIEARFAEHKSDARSGSHLPFLRWLAKHEDEARVVMVEDAPADLNTAEIAWIAHFGLANLLNVCAGGNGGWVPGNEFWRAAPAAHAKRTPEQKRAQALKALETRRQRNSVQEAAEGI